MTFRCPVRDQTQVLKPCRAHWRLTNDLDMVGAVLDGAAQFAEGQFAPLDRIGDTQGSRMAMARSLTPEGFKAGVCGHSSRAVG